MTPDERRLVLEKGQPDPDFEEHVQTYLMFTRIVRYTIIAFPFFMAFILYWTV